METTQQRNSRIAFEDSAAHSAYAHSKDFFNGFATYEIEENKNGSFSVCVRTPHGRTSTNAKTLEKAQSIVEDWKNSTVFAGYPKHFFVKD